MLGRVTNLTRRTRFRSAFRASLALGMALFPSVARSDGAGQALIRGLDSPKKEHPLADRDGRVPVTVSLEPGQTAASLGMREIAPGLAGARLSLADILAFDDDHPGVSLDAGPPLRTMLDVSTGTWTGARAFREATGSDGTGVIVGIIDTGIDLTHPTFITPDQHTRVAWLLTWGQPRGFHPEAEAAMGCSDPSQSTCAVYSAADIDALLSDPNPDLAEDLRDLVGHGTHVAGIAAGNGRTSDGSKAQYVGIAPGATLVVAAPSRGGGFPDDAVIRGTQFVFNRADAMGLPAVANLSLGGDYGPHDGTSPLEKALSSLVGDDKPGRAIVVAAGNSGALYTVGDDHSAGIRTEVRLDAHAPVRVPVLAPNSTQGQVFVWVSYHRGDEVDVGLDGPTGPWISQIASGDDAGYDDGAGLTASVINNKVTGKTALNNDNAGAIVAWDGTWPKSSTFAIELSGHGDVDLWITGTGPVGRTGVFFPRATKAGTISVPATAPGLMAVGCTMNRLAWTSTDGTPIQVAAELSPDSVCYYSSAGPTPTGFRKPEILAPGGFVVSSLGIDADPALVKDSIFDGAQDCPKGGQCFKVGKDYVVSSGTSMSAPHAAGAIALLLQHDPNLTQAELTEIIQASARLPSGARPYDSQVGPGSLSMVHALSVMTQEIPLDLAPDVKQSWWLFSDDTARPDPTFPTWGTLELRRSDGTVASGLDGKKIEVLVDGGTLTKPVAKVRHGLFRFAVAGAPGTGGTKLSVRVLYDGVQIGPTKELSISVDPWIDTGKLDAIGGCVVAGRAESSRASLVAALAVAGALFERRRRRTGESGARST